MTFIYYLIGIIILLFIITICLCKILGSWQPLKSLAISLVSFVVIAFICYLVSLILFSYTANEHWGWLGVILLMTNLTITLLITFPPSILISHAVIKNGGLNGTKEYTLKNKVALFVAVLIVIYLLLIILFKVISWIV